MNQPSLPNSSTYQNPDSLEVKALRYWRLSNFWYRRQTVLTVGELIHEINQVITLPMPKKLYSHLDNLLAAVITNKRCKKTKPPKTTNVVQLQQAKQKAQAAKADKEAKEAKEEQLQIPLAASK